MITLVLKYVLPGLVLAGLVAGFGYWCYTRGYDAEKVNYDEYVQKAQAELADARVAKQKADDSNVATSQRWASDFAASVNSLSAWYAQRVRDAERSAVKTGGVPPPTDSPGGVDVPTTDPLSSTAESDAGVIQLQWQCAVTTQMLEDLQARLRDGGVEIAPPGDHPS